MIPSLPSARRGFTLIELIIVIAIIAVIAAGVFVALDPVKRLNAGRNATRWTDATSIVSAIKLFQSDSSTGSLVFSTPVLDITSANTNPPTVQVIGTATTGCGGPTCTVGGVNYSLTASCIKLHTNFSRYLPTTPYDPSLSAAEGVTESRYFVDYDLVTGAIITGACDAQGEGPGGAAPIPTIKVSQ